MTLATHARKKRGDTRTKMLISAAEVMRERGAAGVTIDEVLTRSGAPRGSVYYHFPERAQPNPRRGAPLRGEAITADIDDAAGRGAKALLRQFVDFWERVLDESDFSAGCPVVAAAIGSAEDEFRWPPRPRGSSRTGVPPWRGRSSPTVSRKQMPNRWR